jgi:uncharacterized protein
MVQLDQMEVRVLGALVEKELSTPEYYPMTVNALVAACNQKSNRDPVVAYSEEQVEEVLESLQRKRFAGTAGGAYSRVPKYRHSLNEVLGLSTAGLGILAELMLRGPQTVGELRGRTVRMHTFDSLEAVEQTLNELAEREQPLAKQLPRQAGRKEVRYAHLLSGEPVPVEPATVSGSNGNVAALEQELFSLKERLDKLEEAFATFRKQFE